MTGKIEILFNSKIRIRLPDANNLATLLNYSHNTVDKLSPYKVLFKKNRYVHYM